MSISISKQSIGQASILIGIFTIISQALGLLRESLIANFLGTSAEYDIILVALAVPAMIGTILMSALPAAGIPSLQNNGNGKAEFSNIIKSSFFRVNFYLGLGLMVGVMICLPFLGRLLGTGLNEHSVSQVLKFGYVFCLLIPIRSVEAAFQSFLHVRYHFLFPAISTIGFNLVIIGLLATLFPSLGPPIYIAAVITGTFVEMILIGIPAIVMYKQTKSNLTVSGFSNSEYLKLLGMIALVEAIGQLVDPFDRYLSGICLSAGYVSANYYANLVGNLPMRIIVVSLSVAIFPSLAEMAAARDIERMTNLYHRAVAICLILMIPIAIFSLLFRNEIISFLFERGRFDERSRALTAGVFFYYALAMVFTSIYFIQSRVLFSLKNWGNLLWARIVGLVAKMAFGLAFINGHWAMAIGGGTMLMSAISVLTVEVNLRHKYNFKLSPESLKLIYKALLGSAFMAIAILILDFGLRNIVGMNSLPLLLAAGLGTGLSFIIVDYFIMIMGIDYSKIAKLKFIKSK